MTCQYGACGADAVALGYLEEHGREVRLCREHALASDACYTLEVYE